MQKFRRAFLYKNKEIFLVNLKFTQVNNVGSGSQV